MVVASYDMADKQSLEFVQELLPLIDENLPPCGVIFCGGGLDVYSSLKGDGEKGKEKDPEKEMKAKMEGKKGKMEAKMEALLKEGWGFMESETSLDWKMGKLGGKGKEKEKAQEVKVEDLVDLGGLDELIMGWQGDTFVTRCEVSVYYFSFLFFSFLFFSFFFSFVFFSFLFFSFLFFSFVFLLFLLLLFSFFSFLFFSFLSIFFFFDFAL